MVFTMLFSILHQFVIPLTAYAGKSEPIAICVDLDGFQDVVGGDSDRTLLWKKGDASVVDGVMRIADSLEGKAGTVVRRNQIRLTHGFSTYFQFQIHDPGNGGYADGLSFIIYEADQPQLGSTGGGLGYKGIDKSIAVEFDIYQNTDLDDPESSHAAIMLNGNNSHYVQPTDSLADCSSLQGSIINAWVDYNNGTVTATFGTENSRSNEGNITISRDVGDFLEEKDVFVGFSASTGGCMAKHDLKEWYFKDSYDSDGLSSYYTQAASTLDINLDNVINPTSVSVAVYDATGKEMENQNIEIFIDNTSMGEFNTGTNGYQYDLSGIESGEHIIRSIVYGGASNFKEFTVSSIANSDNNSVNVGKESVTEGKTVTLTAIGDRQDEEGIYIEDERYIPVSWTSTETGKSGTFSLLGNNYTSTYTTTAAGSYTITATFQKQKWDGTEWKDVSGDTDSKGSTLKVEALVSFNLTATPGNQHVQLSWEPVESTESYDIYTDDIFTATVSSNVYAYDVENLTNGNKYNFQVNALDDSEFVIAISNKVSAVSPHATSKVSSNNDSNTTPVTPPNSGVVILVNGKTENAGIAINSTRGTKTITTIAIDEKKLEQKLEQEGRKAVVIIPVNSKSDVVVGELNGQMIKSMEIKEAILEVKTDTAAYTLPAHQIDIDKISQQLDTQVSLQDIKVQIEIAKSQDETVRIVENSAKKGGFSVVVPPVDFSIKCAHGDKSVEVTNFNAYVERTLAIPDGVDPSKITTGIVTEPDGATRHVPTRVSLVDGKYYARINSLTNSTYVVVYHPIEFKDVGKHWAKEAINDMGSRMVISGTGNDMFEPDRDITRAEFAAIIVKALGLKPGMGTNPFTDVKNSDWCSDYIKTAVEYNIVSGYDNGQFGLTDKVTREQAMTMIANAMKITGLKVEFSEGEIEELLSDFSDSIISSDYAKASIATCIKAGIVSGRKVNLLSPKDNITRAEVAEIVRKLLQKSNLI